MEKRVSCRAIIFTDNKIVAMYREKNDRVYYTFPGGGKNDGETFEDCVKREVVEEFGINVNPIKLVYKYEDLKTIQYFYLCNWESGEFGTGEGEEFQVDRNKGIYIPVLIDTKELKNLPLMPPEVKNILIEDLSKHGESLDIVVKNITGV